MGSCFSKKNTTTLPPPPPPPKPDPKPDLQPPHPTKPDPPPFKKEIFVIKHRISHEIDRHPNQETTTAGDVPPLRRSNSAGAQNPVRRRRYSRSKRSFDLGFHLKPINNINSNNNNNDGNEGDGEDGDDGDDENESVTHGRHRERYRETEARVRVTSSRRSSKERRISISPSRRSESPFGSGLSGNNATVVADGGSSNRPVKMVSVPATDKSGNVGAQQLVVGEVKRINVKRNVSPAKTRVNGIGRNEGDYRRKSLVEIDNNAARCSRPRDTKRTRRLSRDLDVSQEIIFEPEPEPGSGTDPVPSPPSYASLLLEDINNFHKKNTSGSGSGGKMSPSFALPECVNKACLIMEAVADLNSSTSSLCSDDRWRNPTAIKKDSAGMT